LADLFERYTTGPVPADHTTTAQGVQWRGQTFTPSVSHMLTQVKLRMSRRNDPGTVTVSIRLTSAGVPTGGDLAGMVQTFNGALISSSTWVGEWVTITFPSSCLAAAGVMLAIIFRAPTGDDTNCVRMLMEDPDPYAAGAQVTSANSGSSWAATEYDGYFQELGDLVGGMKGLGVGAMAEVMGL